MIRKLILPTVAVLFLAGCWDSSDDKAANTEKTDPHVQKNTQTMAMQQPVDGRDQGTTNLASQGATMSGKSQSVVPQSNGTMETMPQQSNNTQPSNNGTTAPMDSAETKEEPVNIPPMSSNEAMAGPFASKSEAMPHQPMMHNAHPMDSNAMKDPNGTMVRNYNSETPAGKSSVNNEGSKDNSTVEKNPISGVSGMEPQSTDIAPSSNSDIPSSAPEVQATNSKAVVKE